jgi:hypothetical protein
VILKLIVYFKLLQDIFFYSNIMITKCSAVPMRISTKFVDVLFRIEQKTNISHSFAWVFCCLFLLKNQNKFDFTVNSIQAKKHISHTFELKTYLSKRQINVFNGIVKRALIMYLPCCLSLLYANRSGNLQRRCRKMSPVVMQSQVPINSNFRQTHEEVS